MDEKNFIHRNHTFNSHSIHIITLFTCFNMFPVPCPMHNMLLIQLIRRSPHLWRWNRNKSGITSYYMFSYDFQAKFFMIYFAVVWQTSDIQFYGLRFTCYNIFVQWHSAFIISSMQRFQLSTLFNITFVWYSKCNALWLCTL